MIEAARLIGGAVNPRAIEQSADVRRQRRIARRRVTQLISMRRKAAIIIDEARLGSCRDCRTALQPMGGNDQQCAGTLAYRRWDAAQISGHARPRLRRARRRIHEKTRAAAMRNKPDWKTRCSHGPVSNFLKMLSRVPPRSSEGKATGNYEWRAAARLCSPAPRARRWRRQCVLLRPYRNIGLRSASL